jgi:hypothetical protein
VGNPEGGTNRVWKPGHVDLRAHVAVEAQNPMRVAGAFGSRRGRFLNPEGKLKSMGASGTSVPDIGTQERREVVETTRRLP